MQCVWYMYYGDLESTFKLEASLNTFSNTNYILSLTNISVLFDNIFS